MSVTAPWKNPFSARGNAAVTATMLAGALQSLTSWTSKIGWGHIVTADLGADDGGITTAVDVNDLSVSWDAVRGRRYEVTFDGMVGQNTNENGVYVAITDAANALVRAGSRTLSNAAVGEALKFSVEEQGLSGKITRKVRAQTLVGGIAVVLVPSRIQVHDVGPAV